MTKDKIAEYAYEHVPFYKDLVDKKIKIWQDYPIVDKGMVRQNIHSVFSPEYMMDLSKSKVLEIYNRMAEFNPKWMIVQPSIILLFTNVLKAHSLPPLMRKKKRV